MEETKLWTSSIVHLEIFSWPSRLGHVLSNDDVHNERHDAVRWPAIGLWAAVCGVENKKDDLRRGLGDTLPVRLVCVRSFGFWFGLVVDIELSVVLKLLSVELGGLFNFFEHGWEFDDKSKGLRAISGGRFMPLVFIYVSNWLTLPAPAVRTMFNNAWVDDISTKGENNGRLATAGTEDENEFKPKLENNEFWASVALRICFRSISLSLVLDGGKWQDEFNTFGGELLSEFNWGTKFTKGEVEFVLNEENLGSPNVPVKPFFDVL